MKYISKDGKHEVTVTEITDDGYVKIKMNGLELIVEKNRFDKVYVKKEMK